MMTGAASFLAELRRRNVFRAAAIYAAAVWALAQGSGNVDAYAAFLRGNAAAALAEAKLSPTGRDTRTINVAMALQIGDDRAAADAALKALIARPASDQMYGVIADIYALRKDADQVFAWLERSRTNDEGLANGLLADPFLKPYWNDPRFAALCKQLGLPAPGESLPATAPPL